MNTNNHPNQNHSSFISPAFLDRFDELFEYFDSKNEPASNDDSLKIHTNCRPRDALVSIAKCYPNAWKQVDEMRSKRGHGLPMWPNWCFLPLTGAYSIVSGISNSPMADIYSLSDGARLGALAAWRVTQGIYRFDSAVYNAVRNTPISGDIPCDVLQRLPEWCIYLETPEQKYNDEIMHGAWAHLEWDSNTHRQELRILADLDSRTVPIILHLGNWSLEEALSRAIDESPKNIASELASVFNKLISLISLNRTSLIELQKKVVEPVLSLLLYLCSQASEIGDGRHRPKKPQATRVRGEMRTFPPNKVTTWDVGVRMGAALRQAYKTNETDQGGIHVGPRPHIRRAHWHGFRYGPMKGADGTNIATIERKFELHWLPPIAVNLTNTDDLVATVRAVK